MHQSCCSFDVLSVQNLERQAAISCNQNPHLPGSCLVSLALCIRTMALTSWQRQVSGGVPYKVSATDTWHLLVRSHHQPRRLQPNRALTSHVSYQKPPRCSVWSHRLTTRQHPSSSGASNRHQPFTGSSTEPGLEASPGRPPNRWLDQIRTDMGSPPATAWRNNLLRDHHLGATQRPQLGMQQ